MFQEGQLVFYGIHGVCRLLAPEIRRIDRKDVEYLVVSPVSRPDARFYVPAHNEIALSKLLPLLTKEELDALLASCREGEDPWIPEDNRRKLHYKELIAKGDRESIIRMIRSLRYHKNAQLASGRKFHVSDEGFLRDAEHLLSEEFSIVLNISPQEVSTYIENALK